MKPTLIILIAIISGCTGITPNKVKLSHSIDHSNSDSVEAHSTDLGFEWVIK